MGACDGCGELVGGEELTDGTLVGVSEGSLDGFAVGIPVGNSEGSEVGIVEGNIVIDGSEVGSSDGFETGRQEILPAVTLV